MSLSELGTGIIKSAENGGKFFVQEANDKMDESIWFSEKDFIIISEIEGEYGFDWSVSFNTLCPVGGLETVYKMQGNTEDLQPLICNIIKMRT
jgi:hypothetical protein